MLCISPEIDEVKAGHFYFDLEITQNFEKQSSYVTGDNEVEAASIIERSRKVCSWNVKKQLMRLHIGSIFSMKQ